jgi:hypothetical protein
MKILVDSSVLLDVFTQDPQWARWSEEKLALHAERDLLAINAIIYAEVSVHFSTQEELEQVLSPWIFSVCHCRIMRPFWRRNAFSIIGAEAARSGRRCQISTSARMPQRRRPTTEQQPQNVK